MSGKLFHRFRCKQGCRAACRRDDKGNLRFTIPPPDVQVSLQQGFNWSEGARSHSWTQETCRLAYGCSDSLPASSQYTHTHTQIYTRAHTWTVGDIPVSCSIFTHRYLITVFLSTHVERMSLIGMRKYINSNRRTHINTCTYNDTHPHKQRAVWIFSIAELFLLAHH